MKIRELSISARARMCLLTAGYEDIEELRDITDEELLEIRNLNVKGVTEIRAAIEEYFIEEEDESEKDLEDEFKDITIFQRDENIGVTVDFCGLEFDAVSESITISIWVSNKSEDTYDIWIKDLHINGKSHKDFCDIGSVSDYSSGYLEEEIDDIDYEKIQTIRFLVEIDDEDDNELANSKIVTLSCNTEDESFTVESIADYEEEAADIAEGEDIVDDLEENSSDEWLRPAVEMYKASLRGLSKNQNNQNCVLASYPDTVKNIVRKKEDYWEYRLFIEVAIYRYESLQEYRDQKVTFWKNEDCLNRIENTKEFTKFIKSQRNKLLDFVHKIESCINEDLKEAFGEPGETSDVRKIIEATEKLIRTYEDMIEWRLSFEDIDADCTYRRMIELLCQVVESALKNFDVLYSKLQVTKKQFDDLLANRITKEELYLDLNIPFMVHIDDSNAEWNVWKEKYFNI